MRIKTKDYNTVLERDFCKLTGLQFRATCGYYKPFSKMLDFAKEKGGKAELLEACCSSPKGSEDSDSVVSMVCGQLLCVFDYPKVRGFQLPQYYICFVKLRAMLGYPPLRKKRYARELYQRRKEIVFSFFKRATPQQREALATYVGVGARAKEYLLYLSYLLEDKNSGRLHQFVSELSSTLIMDFYKSSEKEKARLQRWANDHKLIELALTYYQSGELRLGDDSEEKLDQAACVVHLLAKSLGVEVGDYQVDVIYQSAIERAEKFYEKETFQLFGITA